MVVKFFFKSIFDYNTTSFARLNNSCYFDSMIDKLLYNKLKAQENIGCNYTCLFMDFWSSDDCTLRIDQKLYIWTSSFRLELLVRQLFKLVQILGWYAGNITIQIPFDSNGNFIYLRNDTNILGFDRLANLGV